VPFEEEEGMGDQPPSLLAGIHWIVIGLPAAVLATFPVLFLSDEGTSPWLWGTASLVCAGVALVAAVQTVRWAFRQIRVRQEAALRQKFRRGLWFLAALAVVVAWYLVDVVGLSLMVYKIRRVQPGMPRAEVESLIGTDIDEEVPRGLEGNRQVNYRVARRQLWEGGPGLVKETRYVHVVYDQQDRVVLVRGKE
jgi:hypothetical protein